ncbi:MAG: hypothetical protein ABIQ39_00785 [Ilumatobacteraceae bacterium]
MTGSPEAGPAVVVGASAAVVATAVETDVESAVVAVAAEVVDSAAGADVADGCVVVLLLSDPHAAATVAKQTSAAIAPRRWPRWPPSRLLERLNLDI